MVLSPSDLHQHEEASERTEAGPDAGSLQESCARLSHILEGCSCFGAVGLWPDWVSAVREEEPQHSEARDAAKLHCAAQRSSDQAASLRGVRGVYTRASRQQKFAYVRSLKVRSKPEESLVPATGRLAQLLAAVNLSIWITASCHPGLNRFEIASTDCVDYLWRRDDYLLHRLRRAAAASLEGAACFLLPSR